LADEAGVDRALLDPENGPLTYEQTWELDEQVSIQDARGSYEQVTWIPWDDHASLLKWAIANKVPLYDNAECRMLLAEQPMLDVATMYADWVERLDFPRLDAFKATYQPPNAPPEQTSFFSGRQLFQITGPWG